MQYILSYEEVQDILREYMAKQLNLDFDKDATTFDWLGLYHDSLDHQPGEVLINPEGHSKDSS